MEDRYPGEVRLFGGGYAPAGWLPCDGAVLDGGRYAALFAALGHRYGGTASQFALPDLRGRIPVHEDPSDGNFGFATAGGSETVALALPSIPEHSHRARGFSGNGTSGDAGSGYWASPAGQLAYDTSAPDKSMDKRSIGETCGDKPHDNMMPFLPVMFVISIDGAPLKGRPTPERILGEVRLFAGEEVPEGWERCDGQVLRIADNQALFSLISETFGGDGRQTFALPDLRGRVPVHRGDRFGYGESGGSKDHTLTMAEMPAHAHPVFAVGAANRGTPATIAGVGRAWASQPSLSPFAPQTDVSFSAAAITSAGGTGSHSNLQPYLTIHACIAVRGIFPQGA